MLKVCTTAVALGATSIERHSTLDRAMYGTDQATSVQVGALRSFVESLRAIPGILGNEKKELTDAEKSVRSKLRIMEHSEVESA